MNTRLLGTARRFPKSTMALAIGALGPAVAANVGQNIFLDLDSHGSILTQYDHNHDCIVDLGDMSRTAAAILESSYPLHNSVDMDQDGSLTAADTVLLLDAVVRASTGDVDGSGGVELTDILLVINEMSQSSISTARVSADLTLDGTVNVDDLARAVGLVSSTPVRPHIDSLDIAERLYTAMPAINLMASAPSLKSANIQSDCGGGFINRVWPKDHLRNVSANWEIDPGSYGPGPIVPGEHRLAYSGSWPPNHLLGVSGGWDAPDECSPRFCDWRPDQPQKWWPTNHTQTISSTWQELPSWEHNTALSKRWPANHSRFVSVDWKGPDDTGTPEGHLLDVSTRWEPNHQILMSRQGTPWDPSSHNVNLSDNWPAEHSNAFSSAWPPSHADQVSATWIDHSRYVSSTWPPNHGSVNSALWYERKIPGGWPANHLYDITVQDDDNPSPPDDLLPPIDPLAYPAHNYFITVNDIYMLPGFPLQNPPVWPPNSNAAP